MAGTITEMTEPDNIDSRGRHIISSANATRDASDPNASESVRSGFAAPSSTQQFSSSDSGNFSSKDELSKLVVDVLRNTSINGVYPTVTGGNIDFALPKNTASEQWSQQNWSNMSGRLSESKAAPVLTGDVQIANSKSTPIANSGIEVANSKSTPIANSGIEVSNSKSTPIANSGIEVANSKSTPIANSGIEVANSRSTPVSDSNIEVANSRSTPVSDSNIEVANSKARPVSDSNVEVANSRATPVSDSNIEVSKSVVNAKSAPITDSDRRVANPMSNTQSRRRGSESACDVNTVTPIYVRAADDSAAMIIYIQESHVISVDPNDPVFNPLEDTMSGDTVPNSQYFLAGGIPKPPSATGLYILGVEVEGNKKKMRWVATDDCNAQS
jgi:hypothetical protein